MQVSVICPSICKTCFLENGKWSFFFSSFPFTWDNMGRKISKDMSAESTIKIHSQKFMHTPGEGLYQIGSKNCDFKFWIFYNFFFLF